MKFKGDIVITDPCYILEGDDYDKKFINKWFSLNRNETLGNESVFPEVFGVNAIVSNTIYGDWSCTVYAGAKSKGKKLGEFCADAGLVCVMTVEDAKRFNPTFFNLKEDGGYGEHCYTVIKDFEGEVVISNVGGKSMFDSDVRVIGTGKNMKTNRSLTFFSVQTGL